MNFREFIEKLEKEGKIKHYTEELSIDKEIAKKIKENDGQVLFFDNVKESEVPVVSGICSSKDLFSLALNTTKEDMIKNIAESIDNPKPIKKGENPLKKIDTDLSKIPALFHYPKDGGPYFSSVIFVTNDEELGINSSFHRCMILDKDKLVARILPRHFDDYVKKGNKEFAICLGCPVHVLLSSAISCEEDKSELDIANALMDTKFYEVEGHTVPDSEIVMIAEITNEEHDEGPFVDLTETYDIVRKQPVIKIKSIYTKENPIYHALLPGGLEHKHLMGMPKEPAIFREVNKVCNCKNVYITPGGSSWLHAVVQIQKQKEDDGKKAIDAAFNGHKSLKHVYIVDEDIDLENSQEVEWAIATRFQANKDLIVKEKQKGSSLDPSSDLESRETAKAGFDLTIPFDKDNEGFKKAEM